MFLSSVYHIFFGSKKRESYSFILLIIFYTSSSWLDFKLIFIYFKKKKDMTIAEIIKEATIQDDFLERLTCQNELLAGIYTDRPCPYIMAAICQCDDLFKVLKLICIHCIVNNGFKQPLFDTYKRELLRAYGFKYFGLVQNVEKVGLFFSHFSKKVLNTLSTKLNLLIDNVNEEMPNDIAYVFCGYAPLSVRFCQYLTRSNWKSYSDLFGMLPGPFVEEQQRLPPGIRKRSINLKKKQPFNKFFQIFQY